LCLATEREELRIVCDQIGAPTCAYDVAAVTTKILQGIYTQDHPQRFISSVCGTYHMTAAGETSWYEFATEILEKARRVSPEIPWFGAATHGRRLTASRVLPISTEEFRSPTRRPAYSVLSNSRLTQAFGVTLPHWRNQLHRCFVPTALTSK
jgi:dTDP-4-dehydrorhamnose reductase